MRIYGASLLILFPILASAQTPVVTNPTGSQTVNQPTGTTLTSNSFDNNLYIDAFGGSDLSAKINAALASVAGTSVSPTPSAIVNLSPGQTYITSPILVPGSYASPYIFNVTIDCHGSTIQFNTSASTSADIVIAPGAAFSSANGPGRIINCTLYRPDTNGPILEADSRVGLDIENTRFWGGSIGFHGVSTTQGVVGGATYLEQLEFDNDSWDGFSDAAIDYDVDSANPGTGSYLYTKGMHLKFDFNVGHYGLRIENGAGIMGGRYDIQANIGGGSTDYHMITNNGALISSMFTLSGEDTGLPTGHVYFVDGSSYSNPYLINMMRIGSGTPAFGANANPSLPTGCFLSENPFEARTGINCLGSNYTAYLANEGGDGTASGSTGLNNSQWQVNRSTTVNDIDKANDPGISQYNQLFVRSDTNGVGVGPHYNDSASTWTYTADTTASSTTLNNVQFINSHYIGEPISGAGIPSGTAITSIPTTSTMTMSAAATATATGVTLTTTANSAPEYTLATRGTIGSTPFPNTQSVLGGEGHYWQWDGSGNLLHYINTENFPGQPSLAYKELFRQSDVTGPAYVVGYQANESGGFVNYSFNGGISAYQIVSSSTISYQHPVSTLPTGVLPTVTVMSGAGTGASASFPPPVYTSASMTDSSGIIAVLFGAGSTVGTDIFQLTFANSWSRDPKCLTTPASLNAATPGDAVAFVDASATEVTTTYFRAKLANAPLSTGTAYYWTYKCEQ